MSIAKPASAFIFDESLSVDVRRVLIVVYIENDNMISVYMPEHVSRMMSSTLPDDILASITDFLQNVPHGKTD